MVVKRGEVYYVVFESIEYNAGPYSLNKARLENKKAIEFMKPYLKLSDLSCTFLKEIKLNQ